MQTQALETGIGYGSQIGLGVQDIRITIANIIRGILGFLGIVAVAIILYGGFLYMTAQGIPEKVLLARKVLISALIGLIIIFSAYAITSFIINKLIEATGAPGVIPGTPGPTPPPITPPPWFTFCPDPDEASPLPFICSISPASGGKDSFVTIKGGKFLNYATTTSKVYFKKGNDTYPANIASCQGTLSWLDYQIVVEVPELIYTAGDNNYLIIVETSNGNSEYKTTGGFVPVNQFTYTMDQPGPGIAMIVPGEGVKATAVTVCGKNFGTAQGTSNLIFWQNVNATVSNWSDQLLNSIVPDAAISGDVSVKVGTKNSNGYFFQVTCQSNDDCVSGCCSYNLCSPDNYCAPGIGESCDTDTTNDVCDLGICSPGLICDACTCRGIQPGDPCDSDPEVDECQADTTLCGSASEFYCSTQTCQCKYLPVIENVVPDNGAIGNYITIWGHGFGSPKNNNSKVAFLGFYDSSDDKGAIFPSGCGETMVWTDNQVIVEVPPNAHSGPILLQNTETFRETTSDADGWKGNFIINDNVRPSICGSDPASGEFGTSVKILGKAFGATKGQSLLGGVEFDNKPNWLWADTEISLLKVPNIKPAVLPVTINVGTVNSNPYNFEVLVSPTAPYIEYIDPVQGPIGQYVTIIGRNFGQDVGVVWFKKIAEEIDYKQGLAADTNFPTSCATGYWQDNYIVVKVPVGLALNETEILVETTTQGISNSVAFSRCNVGPTCPLRPGICTISPKQGPIGTSGVTLYGENFGSFGEQSKVIFHDNKEVPDLDLSTNWTNNKVGTGLLNNGPLTVPADAQTGPGPVKLIDQNGIVSNQILFEVADCRDTPAICTGGDICCQKNGLCQTAEECAPAAMEACTYSWSFTTGTAEVIFGPPHVVEDIFCLKDTQSPSPWNDSTNNCVNTLISARFAYKDGTEANMDAASVNPANIEVQVCNLGIDFDDTKCTEALTIQPSQISLMHDNIGFILTPQNPLVANNWYRVILKGDLPTQTGFKSAQGMILDGNNDGKEGGNYSWKFRVRDIEEACALDRVIATPQYAVLNTLSETQGYNAFALAANCNILNGNAYDWHWYKVYNDTVIEQASELLENYGLATLTENDFLPLPGGNDGHIDWKQTATPQKQGFVNIGAEVFPKPDPKNKYDQDNQLVIDLNIPVIDSFYPKDGLMQEEVQNYVTIEGRNFGKMQGNSRVYFDEIIAPLADCEKPWTDTMISVKVPKAQPVSPEIQPTYSLPALEKDDNMILMYDFEDTSSTVLKDKLGSYDGELKGGTRIRDQFSQALLLNGTSDYIKLPNSLNLNSGSIELWFKPSGTGKQTLISASDGTANNLFSLDYDPGLNASGAVKANQWNHLVYTYDGSTATLYLNGLTFENFISNYGIRKTGNFIGANKNNILIGSKNTGIFSEYFKGIIDGFAIYSNVLDRETVKNRYGLKRGQILLLNFDESGATIKDSSANQFAGLAIDHPDISFRIDSGKNGKAIKFNNDNHINILNNPSLAFGQEISIEGWFKVAIPGQSNIIYEGFSSLAGIKLGILPECGGFCMRIATAAGIKYASLPTSNILANQWNYFAGIYDGSAVKIYLNEDHAEYAATGLITQTQDLYNGYIGGKTNNFNGSLDDFAIYNRALTLDEISSRIGAHDDSFIKVVTDFGEDNTDFNNNKQKETGEIFEFSDNVYPFLCSLNPDFGPQGIQVAAAGDNFGDIFKQILGGKEYGVGSYVNFNYTTQDVMRFLGVDFGQINSWANKLIEYNNPLAALTQSPVYAYVSIDPYAEPYNDALPKNGQYDIGEEFVNLEKQGNTENYDNGTALKSNYQPFYQPPIITQISPDNGPVKQWVTIIGNNFGITAGTVYFYNNQVASSCC